MDPEFGTEGELRLAENSTDEQANRVTGRLEAYINGAWGAIGARSFDHSDAKVACRQLGYHDEGNGPIANVNTVHMRPRGNCSHR